MIYLLFVVVLIVACTICYMWGFGDGCYEKNRYVSGNWPSKRENDL